MHDSRHVLALLRRYISAEVLEGRDEGLEPTSPLLAWGVINSLEMARLAAYIRREFGVEVPADRMLPQHFKDLNAITALVVELRNAR